MVELEAPGKRLLLHDLVNSVLDRPYFLAASFLCRKHRHIIIESVAHSRPAPLFASFRAVATLLPDAWRLRFFRVNLTI
jgi:hypothetical protein